VNIPWYIWISVFSIVLPLVGVVIYLTQRQRTGYDQRIFATLIITSSIVQAAGLVMALNLVDNYLLNHIYTIVELGLILMILNNWLPKRSKIVYLFIIPVISAEFIYGNINTFDDALTICEASVLLIVCIAVLFKTVFKKNCRFYKIAFVSAIMEYSILALLSFLIIREHAGAAMIIFSAGNITNNILLGVTAWSMITRFTYAQAG